MGIFHVNAILLNKIEMILSPTKLDHKVLFVAFLFMVRNYHHHHHISGE